MYARPIESSPNESRFHSLRYVLIGSLFGFLIGIAFVGTGTVVDKLLYRDLPLGIDWSLFAFRAKWIVLGLTLIGATSALFKEAFPSLFAGAMVAGVFALLNGLLYSAASTTLKVLVMIFGLIPIAVLLLPAPLLLRWLANESVQAIESKSVFRIVSLFVLAVVVGLAGGYYMKMSGRAAEATRFMHQTLQETPQREHNLVWDLPGFQEHSRMRYQIIQKSSATSTEGFDISAEYEDRYTVVCTVVVYPGSNPYIKGCASHQK